MAVAFFGDMSLACSLGSRRELTAKLLSERFATSDQLAIVVTARMDINVHDIGDNTTPGPLVALIGD